MLSKREEEVLKLVAHGLSADEIADKFFRSADTVKKTIRNVKEKLALQKATELTAYYWCRAFGDSFKERRNRLLSISLLVLISFSNPFYDHKARRIRQQVRIRQRVEYYHTFYLN
jgi:DNA-binding CsgD family transcriptional regulator